MPDPAVTVPSASEWCVGKDHWFRDAWCSLFLHSCKLLLQGLLVPFELLQLFMVMGLHLAISHPDLPLQLPNFSFLSPQAPFYGSGNSLSQTLEAREGISGTHGYAVLIQTTQQNSINKHKQNTISARGISTWKACDPSLLSILLLSD